MNTSSRHGNILVISGPSGVGKGTLIQEVAQKDPLVKISVSATTRPPRTYELAGEHYYFVSDSEFDDLITRNEFVEWAKVHEHRYGTLKEEIKKTIESGKDIILEIDVQGAHSIRQSDLARTFTIFISPPSFQDLISRLNQRNTEHPEMIQSRLLVAGKELASIGEYDYIVVNDRLEDAVSQVLNILQQLRKDTPPCQETPE